MWHQRIIVRVFRSHSGYVFQWLKRRRVAPSKYDWREWRAYVSGTFDFREALRGYRDYAEYWTTGQY